MTLIQSRPTKSYGFQQRSLDLTKQVTLSSTSSVYSSFLQRFQEYVTCLKLQLMVPSTTIHLEVLNSMRVDGYQCGVTMVTNWLVIQGCIADLLVGHLFQLAHVSFLLVILPTAPISSDLAKSGENIDFAKITR